jgi:hypothetical protein
MTLCTRISHYASLFRSVKLSFMNMTLRTRISNYVPIEQRLYFFFNATSLFFFNAYQATSLLNYDSIFRLLYLCFMYNKPPPNISNTLAAH